MASKKRAPKKAPVSRPEDLSADSVARAIKIPVMDWPGNCFAIASQMVDSGLVQGVAVYGHYAGRVSRAKGAYYAGKGSTQHGWIRLFDGRVLDPTRWVFENVAPYLHLGPLTKEYDEGGNDLNKALRGGPPAFDPSEDQREFTKKMIGSKAYNHIERLLRIDLTKQEPGFLTKRQICWLANVHFDELQPHAEEIYRAIEKLGRSFAGLIPFENRERARRIAAGSPV